MLVVGLGNPGDRYAGSPHNVGFRVLDELAQHVGQVSWSQRFRGKFAVARVGEEKLALLEPQTFMNRSGESVREALSFFKLEHDRALVVHDELDLPLGSVKLKRGGGEAGHNGLRSVTKELGTQDYCRVRVGVGRPAKGAVVDFLLSPLSAVENAELDAAVLRARDAIELVVKQGFERAMNAVNRSPITARETPDRAVTAASEPDPSVSAASGLSGALPGVPPGAGRSD
jgi:peptidyl-tRNA hydrolase, PTH1 family